MQRPGARHVGIVNAADDAGDNIFVYAGNYSGGLTLLNSQKLIGDGSSSDLAATTGLIAPAYSTPLPAFSGKIMKNFSPR